MRRALPILTGTTSGLALVALTFGCGGGGGGSSGGPFGLTLRDPVTTLTFPLGTPTLGAISIADAFPNLSSFASPVFVTNAPAGNDRLFVVEQIGRIRVFASGSGISAVVAQGPDGRLPLGGIERTPLDRRLAWPEVVGRASAHIPAAPLQTRWNLGANGGLQVSSALLTVVLHD